MAKGDSISIKGLKGLQKKIGSIPKSVVSEVDPLMRESASKYANLAIADAPVDESLLRQGISFEKNKEMDYAVISSAPYSPFIEFGTGRRAKIPSDLVEYAAQFKGGKGGDGQGFYDEILDWVKRKGIAATFSVKTRKRTGNKLDNQIADEQAAFAIYLSILRHGINAQPFFFKHREPIFGQLVKDIAPALQRALKK